MAHREIPIPGALAGAIELVRIFRRENGDMAYLVRGPQDGDSADPGVWGIVAVDLLHHVASVLHKVGIDSPDGPLSRGAILDRMRELFNAEWERRTDEARRLTDA
jgi:hypothetical protein